MTDFSPKSKKIFKNPKNPNWVEKTEYNVLVWICTQKGQQLTKIGCFW
jgi:hypothetical protein